MLVVEAEHMELEVELPAKNNPLAEVGCEMELPSSGLICEKRQVLNLHDERNLLKKGWPIAT
jgi:hypothetical protein